MRAPFHTVRPVCATHPRDQVCDAVDRHCPFRPPSARLIFPGAYGGATSGAFSAAAFAFALGSAGQHASVDVRGLGTLLSFSVHSFLIG